MWSSVIWFAVPAVILLPMALHRWDSIKSGGIDLQITAFLSGLALLFYTLAFLYTDVIRAMLLYYLTPIWSTLLAALVLGEKITFQRIIAIFFAVMGMLIIFGLGLNFPIPRNLGDWMGICSGIVWAVAIVRIRKYENHSAIDMTVGFFLWSVVIALIACLALVSHEAANYLANAINTSMAFSIYGFVGYTRGICILVGTKICQPRAGEFTDDDRNNIRFYYRCAFCE